MKKTAMRMMMLVVLLGTAVTMAQAETSQEDSVNKSASEKKAKQELLLARIKKTIEPLNPKYFDVKRVEQVKAEKTHTYVEGIASVGAWKSTSEKSSGVDASLESMVWSGSSDGTQNLGVGALLGFDHGWGENSAKWGYLNPQLQGGLWKEVGEDSYLLVKPRIGYRFNEKEKFPTSKPAEGMTLGIYSDVSHVFGARDLGIIALDGNMFKKDSYLALRGYWEHIVDKDWKVKAGIGPVGHFQEKTQWGVSPVVGIKYKDTWSASLIGDTVGSVGINLMYSYDSDRHDPLTLKQAK